MSKRLDEADYYNLYLKWQWLRHQCLLTLLWGLRKQEEARKQTQSVARTRPIMYFLPQLVSHLVCSQFSWRIIFLFPVC